MYHTNTVFGYNDPPEIKIYSLNSGVLRRVIGVEIKHCMVDAKWSQTFVNGFKNWIDYDIVV